MLYRELNDSSSDSCVFEVVWLDENMQELSEAGAMAHFVRKGSKVVKKYRCMSGVRKGQLVSDPSSCNKPIDQRRSAIAKRFASKGIATRRRKRGNIYQKTPIRFVKPTMTKRKYNKIES